MAGPAEAGKRKSYAGSLGSVYTNGKLWWEIKVSKSIEVLFPSSLESSSL